MRIPLTDIEGVAVRRGAGHAADTNAATRTAYVLDDDGLAEKTTHFFDEDAPNNICRSAGRKWDDDCDRPGRIGLRLSEGRQGRQHGSARGQMQEFASGKFQHGVLPTPARHVAFRRSICGRMKPGAAADGILAALQ